MLTISAADSSCDGIHAHVERRVVGVGEAALPGVDLHRRHPQVHVDEVGGQPLVAQQREAGGEVGADEAGLAGDIGRQLGKALLGERVAVDPDQRPGGADAIRDQPRVTGAADGAVDGNRSRSGVEKLDQLAGQDGHVRRCHVNQCGQSLL